MTTLRLRTVGIAAIVTLVAGAAIAFAITGPQLGAQSGPGRAAASVTSERFAAGPYRLTITRTETATADRADIRLTDETGALVAGKSVTGLLRYEGTALGHEHHDILVSQEPDAGHYVLELREAIAGRWLLTVFIGDEARAAYFFDVR